MHGDAARRRSRTRSTSGKATEHFAQDGRAARRPRRFRRAAWTRHLAPAPIVRDVFAPATGIVSAIDTRGVGMAVVALGGGRRLPTDTIDHASASTGLPASARRSTPRPPLARIHARDEATRGGGRAAAASPPTASASAAPKHPLIADRDRPAEGCADAPRHPLHPRQLRHRRRARRRGTTATATATPTHGADTLGHIAAQLRPASCPNLDALGLGAAAQALDRHASPRGLTDQPKAAAGASAARSRKGKDTPSGHWEIAGVPVPFDWGYFPQTIPTFPPDLIAELIERGEAARHSRRQARLRHHHHRGARRGAHPDRQADLLHLDRLACSRSPRTRRISASSGSTRSARSPSS